MKNESKKVILAALIGNLLISVCKMVVAAISGSTAMLAEAVHSLADTGNQVLLMIGLRLSQRPADELHPFGYGKERYFWAMIVAITMFVVGAAVSLWEGVGKILHPHPIEHLGWIYLVLGLSALLESYPWYLAYTTLKKSSNGQSLWTTIRRSKTPAIIVVFLEDSAALTGILLAFLGTLAAHLTGLSVFDGIASVGIGLLLAFVAFCIAYEIKSLLIGECASAEDYRKILAAVADCSGVEELSNLLTMHLGPEQLLVNLNLKFSAGLPTEQIEDLINQMEDRIRKEVPSAKHIFIEVHKK